MNKSYIKHLIECQCILKIFQNKTKPVYHKFIVFSIIDEQDEFIEKFVECNNCGLIHRVFDINKSEPIYGKETVVGLISKIEDIKFNLNNNEKYKNIVNILESNLIKDIVIWEHVEFLYENNLTGIIQLEKNEIKNNIVLKNLYINETDYRIKNETFQRYI